MSLLEISTLSRFLWRPVIERLPEGGFRAGLEVVGSSEYWPIPQVCPYSSQVLAHEAMHHYARAHGLTVTCPGFVDDDLLLWPCGSNKIPQVIDVSLSVVLTAKGFLANLHWGPRMVLVKPVLAAGGQRYFARGEDAYLAGCELADKKDAKIVNCSGYIDWNGRHRFHGLNKSTKVSCRLQVTKLADGFVAQAQADWDAPGLTPGATKPKLVDINLPISGTTLLRYSDGKRAQQALHATVSSLGLKVGRCSGYLTPGYNRMTRDNQRQSLQFKIIERDGQILVTDSWRLLEQPFDDYEAARAWAQETGLAIA